MKENELIKVQQNNDGILTVSSREVAKNFTKEHSKVIRSIENIISSQPSQNWLRYFIASEYKDSKGEMRKEYLLTRDGFSLIVMGFTGSKALAWKIKYIEAFNNMEEYIKKSLQQPSYLIENPIERAKRWIQEQEETQLLIGKVEELSPLAKLAKKRLDKTGIVSITDVTKTYDLKRGQISTWAKTKGYIHKTLKEVNKAGEEFFKVIDVDGFKNVAILEEGIREIDKNIDDIKIAPTSYKKVS